MTTSSPFTVYRLPLSIRYPFTVYRYQWLRDQGKGRANGEGLKANGFTGGKAC